MAVATTGFVVVSSIFTYRHVLFLNATMFWIHDAIPTALPNATGHPWFRFSRRNALHASLALVRMCHRVVSVSNGIAEMEEE